MEETTISIKVTNVSYVQLFKDGEMIADDEIVKGVEKYSIDSNKLYNFILSEGGLENEC